MAQKFEAAYRMKLTEAQARKIVSDIYQGLHGEQPYHATVQKFLTGSTPRCGSTGGRVIASEPSMPGDASLLREFVDESSDVAFRELVLRRFDFVYGAALRQVGGDVHLAREVAQNVFIDLARKSRTLATRTNLAGWLYTSTRFAAAKALRSRTRRLTHETAAHQMNEIVHARAKDEISWSELRPVLDAAMHELAENHREALLLRYFDGLSHAEIGTVAGVGENAARMRVERALEKLRERLRGHGITSTAAAVGAALAGQPAVSAPVGLAASVAGASLAGAAAAASAPVGLALSVLHFMSTGKLITGIAGAAAAVAVGVYFGAHRQNHASQSVAPAASLLRPDEPLLREENRRLRSELARLSAEHTALVTTQGDRPHQTEARRNALDRLRILTDLQRRKLAKSEMDFVDSGTQLTPAFSELFAVTPAEQEALQRSLDTSRETLGELERANATVSPQPNGDVIVTVKAFPEAGGQLYDALLRTFAETLGPERYSAFLALGIEQVEKSLGRFGAPQRTITFSRMTTDDNSVHYSMREVSRLPKENGNYSSDFKNFDDLAQQAGSIVKLLPSGFAPRK